MPPQQSLQHVVRGSKDVTHIVEDRKTKSFAKVWQRDRRKTQFEVIHEQRRAADRKTGIRVARSCLI